MRDNANSKALASNLNQPEIETIGYFHSMEQAVAFYADAARQCYEIARQCSPEDCTIAEELIALGHRLVERAISLGAAPEDLPQP